MTDSDIKNCYFVHYFFREGGYGDFDQISPLLFFTIHDGRGVQMDIVPNSLFSLFFWQASLTCCQLNCTYYMTEWCVDITGYFMLPTIQTRYECHHLAARSYNSNLCVLYCSSQPWVVLHFGPNLESFTLINKPYSYSPALSSSGFWRMNCQLHQLLWASLQVQLLLVDPENLWTGCCC